MSALTIPDRDHGVYVRNLASRRFSRSDIVSCARKQDPHIGAEAMIAEMEWGYWIGSIYVSKADILMSLRLKLTPEEIKTLGIES